LRLPRVKSARHVKAGKASAAARWGPEGRVVRLDALDPVTRDIVIAILRARRAAESAVEQS
jgi:hypothetical protein